jgi:hypothetical protein
MSDLSEYEKDDGEPCQLPASRDDGRCHHHTEVNDQRANGGREWAIDEDDHDEILEGARMGMSKTGCARLAGVDKASLLRYLDAHPDFRTAFARARARGEQRLISGPLVDDEDSPDMDGQHARFLLSTSFDYVETERHELENTGDEPLSELVIDFDNVDT